MRALRNLVESTRFFLTAKAVLKRLYRKDIETFLRKHFGLVVLTGPFSGMQYIDRAHGSAYLPKLLGSYEHELNSLL